jgi:phospholipid/cholesterol/gamma-HCH transport system substrate-binding protein
MGKHVIETIMGAVVLVVAAGFLVFAYRSSDITSSTQGYNLVANFDRADGLGIGSDVRISGVKVGSVSGQNLDPNTYQAKITITISDDVKIPSDSTAEIASDGLLGGKYLALVPGGDEKMLKKGDRIKFTQSAVSLESLIGKFMYGGTDSKEPQSKDVPAGSAPATTQQPVEGEEGHKNVLD